MKRTSLLLLVTLLNSFVFARAITIPENFSPYFIYEDDKESFSGQEIIELSLNFGMTEKDSDNWNLTLEGYKALRKYTAGQVEGLSPEATGEMLLTCMYEKVLDSYNFDQTRLDLMFKTGVYNCVSSSLLYLALAKDFGLDARVQETKDHAFIILYLPGSQITVETTNPYGFNPGQKRLLESSNGVTKYAVIPAKTYRNKIEVSERRAITLVSNNIISGWNNSFIYTDIIPLSVSSMQFVQKEEDKARSEFDAVVSNIAAAAALDNKTSQALDFLEKIFGSYGSDSQLSATYNNLAYNEAAFAVNDMDLDLAKENVEKRKPYLSEKNYKSTYNSIYETEYYNRAAAAAGTGDYLAAVIIVDEGLYLVPDSKNLKNYRSQCLQNHGIMVHNQIVPLLNAQKYEQSLEILKTAMTDNPNNRTLINDYNRISKIIKK